MKVSVSEHSYAYDMMKELHRLKLCCITQYRIKGQFPLAWLPAGSLTAAWVIKETISQDEKRVTC